MDRSRVDDFNHSIIKNCLKKIPNFVQYGLWSGTRIYEQEFPSAIPDPYFILVNYDIFEHGEYDHTCEAQLKTAKKLLDLIQSNPSTQFVLFHQQGNLEKEIQHPRLQMVRYGGGLGREQASYEILEPQTQKDLSLAKNFVCLNRHPRQYRINLVSYLLGKDLERHGTITFGDNLSATSWLERVSWNLDTKQISQIKPILERGFDKSKTLDLYGSIDMVNNIYTSGIDNAKNFDLYLRHIYRQHLVEIVAETIFNFAHYGISEKFLNSVYGCNFPIVLGGPGVVKYLRDLGFDMFDDVIDHSYDYIMDPLDRMCAAIDSNMVLLTDLDLAKSLWQQHVARFIRNIKFAKTQMYSILEQRSYEEFGKIKWNI